MTRPVMPALASPSKSPTFTSTQVTRGFQVAQREFVKEEPVDWPTHHWPDCSTRPTMSSLPSPLKSPTRMSTQLTFGFHVVPNDHVSAGPMHRPFHHRPVSS